MAEIFRPAGFDETFERSIIFRHEGKNKRSGIALKRKLKTIEINYLRLIMPLPLSRGILLRPRSECVETMLSSFVSMEACRFVYILANRRP